jgi:hypothetical protein
MTSLVEVVVFTSLFCTVVLVATVGPFSSLVLVTAAGVAGGGQLDAEQSAGADSQPSTFTLMAVTDPGARLVKLALDCQVVPSMLYCTPVPAAGLVNVTLPVVGPQSEGWVTQKVNWVGVVFGAAVTEFEAMLVHPLAAV